MIVHFVLFNRRLVATYTQVTGETCINYLNYNFQDHLACNTSGTFWSVLTFSGIHIAAVIASLRNSCSSEATVYPNFSFCLPLCVCVLTTHCVCVCACVCTRNCACLCF